MNKAIKGKKFKQIVASIMLGMMAGSSLPYSVALADGPESGSTESGSNNKENKVANAAQQVMGAVGSLPIVGSNAKVSWKTNVKNVQVYPVCTGTKAPTQNETATYYCAIYGKNAYGASIPISATVSGGKQELSGIAPFTYKTIGEDGKPKWAVGIATLTVGINGYEGKTTMGGNDPFSTFGADGVDPTWTGGVNGGTNDDPTWTGVSGGTTDTTWGPTTGNSPCPDGTNYCTSSTDSRTLFGPDDDDNGNKPWVQNGSDGGGSFGSGSGGTGGTGTTWTPGGTGSTGSDNPWVDYGDGGGSFGSGSGGTGGTGTTGTTGSGGGYYDDQGVWHTGDGPTNSQHETYDSSSTTNYGDALDRLLNDNNSYNSDDAEWLSSNGGKEGTSNLDDYFNGLESSSDGASGMDSDLDGLTEDLLGVDEDLFGDHSGDGSDMGEDGYNYGEEGYGDGEFGENDGTDSDEDGSELWGNGDMSVQDLIQALDGITDGGISNELNGGSNNGTGADGNGFGKSSLADTLSQFLHSVDDKSGEGVKGVDVTEQDLFDLAKKLLLANGMSLDDILSGKSYDHGSAYTEPRQAWDMNRITKLLKSGKIKVQKEESEKNTPNSITNASNSNKAINANIKKK